MAAAMLLSALFYVSSVAAAAAPVKVYFGLGCYWGSQNTLVERLERAVLKRADDEITSIAGYAGSKRTGPHGQLCYYNDANVSIYSELGHGEVTQVEVPPTALAEAFSVYFSAFKNYSDIFARADYFDEGANFRAMVGFPGGMGNKPAMAAVRAGNLNNMTLVAGHGSDKDTFLTNTVLVMDSDAFPFTQAEVCMQFYDDSAQGVYFNASYLALRPILVENGRLLPTTCPHVYLCDANSPEAAFI